MAHRRRVVVGISLFALVSGCNGITYPTSPTIEPSPAAPAVTNLSLSATPDRLPATGGEAAVVIRAMRRTNGTEAGVGGVALKLSSTEGTLSALELTTNEAGEAHVTWRSAATGTVIARAGDLNASITIPLETVVPPPVPPTTPTPTPSPSPAPPAPAPPTPVPAVPITLTANPSAPVINDTVTFTASATLPAGVGAVRGYEWDFGDGTRRETTAGSPTTTHTYATPGARTALVTVRTTTWANGTASAVVSVTDIAPTVPVTLAASPTTVGPGETFTLTATATPNRTAGTVTTFEWDFDNNGTVDRSTATESTTHSYPVIGNNTVKVTVRTSSGTSNSATETVSVTAPALNVALTTDLLTAAAGTARTFMATVGAASGVVPGSLTFEWDYNNDGTADETTTGASPGTVTHTYNGTPGARTVRVTVKASDGRSATNTLSVTVS